MHEYLPVLILGAIIGVFTLIFVIAYALEKNKKDSMGFDRHMSDREIIAKQDYILTPGRYVGIEEQEDDGEPFDEKMKRLTGELSEMFAKSHELEDKIRKNLGAIGYEI